VGFDQAGHEPGGGTRSAKSHVVEVARLRNHITHCQINPRKAGARRANEKVEGRIINAITTGERK